MQLFESDDSVTINSKASLLLARRALLRLFSPAGLGGRLSILIYHRVLAQQDPVFPEEIKDK